MVCRLHDLGFCDSSSPRIRIHTRPLWLSAHWPVDSVERASASRDRRGRLDQVAVQGGNLQLVAARYDPWVGWGRLGGFFFSRARNNNKGDHTRAAHAAPT